MSSVNNVASGVVLPTPSPHLAVHYKINRDDGAGLEDSSPNSNDLTGASSAGFWSTRQGAGTFDGTTDEFTTGDTTSMELGTSSGPKCMLVSLRVNGTPAAVGHLIGKRSTTLGVSFDINATATGFIKMMVNASPVLNTTINCGDGSDHHYVGFFDPGGTNRNFVDGAADQVTAYAATSCVGTAAEFMVGTSNTVASPVRRYAGELWDVQLYLPESIPANYQQLVDYLYTHPGLPIPAELWS